MNSRIGKNMLDLSSSIHQCLVNLPEQGAFDRIVMKKAEKGEAW